MASGGSWAVILGVSSGTGESIARCVAAVPGFHVFGVHRGHYPDQARELERHVSGLGRKIVLRTGDAGTAEGAAAGAAELREVAGPRSVGLFVHSIANGSLGPLTSLDGSHLPPAKVEKTMTSMAHSFVYWAQALRELELLAPRARLFGLSNVLTESTLTRCSVIGAAKAALEHYVKHLAMELGPEGHRVNLIKFSTVVTEALSHVFDEEAMARCEAVHAKATPAGRMLTTAEVGRLVRLLCRDEADWFNGATIDFTGGMAQHLLEMVMYPSDE